MRISIAVPGEIFKVSERLARQLGVSRDQLYADALSAYLNERAAAAITARLNAVHGNRPQPLDPAFAAAQAAVMVDESW